MSDFSDLFRVMDFDKEEARRWFQEGDVAKALRHMNECADAGSIDALIALADHYLDAGVLDTAALSRQAGLAFGQDLKAALTDDIPGNWSVRVWVPCKSPSGTDELLVWLEVDRWRVAEFRGKRTGLAFESSEEFQRAIWDC